MLKQRISSIVGVFGGFLVLLSSSCAPKITTPISTAEPFQITKPAEKSNITIVIAEEPPSFNAMIADTGYDALVMELVMLGLADVDPQGNVFPELAAEIPSIENGGVQLYEEEGTMDVTWRLRKDIVWQDGEPVTADDVLFTWEAIKNPETGSWIQGIDYIDDLERVDEYTFIVHYNTIYPGYLTFLGGEQLVVWPEHYCNPEQGFVAWDCARKPLSNGPYILKEWEIGDHLTFVRNPNYYQPGKPNIDEIIVKIVPDSAVRKTMLIQGEADLDMWITEPVAAELENQPNVKISQSESNRWVMRLFFNLAARGTTDSQATPHPILSDVRVRQAIRMAIDVDTISEKIFYGYSKPTWTEFFRPPYNNCNIPRPRYDPEMAASLLEQAGWIDQDGNGVRECRNCLNAEEGYPMEMELIGYAEYGDPLQLTQQLIAEMLSKIGINLRLTLVQGSILWADAESGGIEQRGDFDIDIWDDGYAGIDPTDFIWELYSIEAAQPGYGWNIGRWINEEFDALIDEAYTLDEEKRKEVFCQMAEILDREIPNALLFTTINADAHSTRLTGIQTSVSDQVTWNVAEWQISK